jgi:hypothetical protein
MAAEGGAGGVGAPIPNIVQNKYTLPYPKNVKPHNIFYNPDEYNTTSRMTSCKKVNIHGKDAFIQLRMPPKATEEQKVAIRACIADVNPLFTVKDIPMLPNGIYTYILCDKGFFANMANTTIELGTVHIQLAARVKCTKLFGAGELRMRDSKKEELPKDAIGDLKSADFGRIRLLEYNFMSGTYMLGRSDIEAVKAYVHGFFTWTQRLFKNIFFIRFDEKTFIDDTSDSLDITPVFLAQSQVCGLDIDIYDDKRSCVDIGTIYGYIDSFILNGQSMLNKLHALRVASEFDHPYTLDTPEFAAFWGHIGDIIKDESIKKQIVTDIEYRNRNRVDYANKIFEAIKAKKPDFDYDKANPCPQLTELLKSGAMYDILATLKREVKFVGGSRSRRRSKKCRRTYQKNR